MWVNRFSVECKHYFFLHFIDYFMEDARKNIEKHKKLNLLQYQLNNLKTSHKLL